MVSPMKTTVLLVPFIPLCFVPGFTTTQWTWVLSTAPCLSNFHTLWYKCIPQLLHIYHVWP